VIFCAAMNVTPPIRRMLPILLAVLAPFVGAVATAGAFTTFDTGQVRPLALSPDGQRLYAANTPDNRVEIFSLATGTPVHVGAVEVGLEPVAIAARSDGEIWVVNHLSDSISHGNLTRVGVEYELR